MPVVNRSGRAELAKGAATTERRTTTIEGGAAGTSARKTVVQSTTVSRRAAPRDVSPSTTASSASYSTSTSTSTSRSSTTTESSYSSSPSDASSLRRDRRENAYDSHHRSRQQLGRTGVAPSASALRRDGSKGAPRHRHEQQYVHILDKNLRVPVVDRLAGTRARLRHPDLNPEDAMAAEDAAAFFGERRPGSSSRQRPAAAPGAQRAKPGAAAELHSAASSFQESVEGAVGGAIDVVGHAATAVGRGVAGVARGAVGAGRAVVHAAKRSTAPAEPHHARSESHTTRRHHYHRHDRAAPRVDRDTRRDFTDTARGPRVPPEAARRAKAPPGVDVDAGRRDQRRHPRLDKEDAMAEGDKEALRTLGRRMEQGVDEAAGAVSRLGKDVTDDVAGAIDGARRRATDDDDALRRLRRQDKRDRQERQATASVHFRNAANASHDHSTSALDVDAGRRAQRLHPQLDKEDAMAAEDRATLHRARDAVLESSLVREAHTLGRNMRQRAQVATDVVRRSVSSLGSPPEVKADALEGVVKHARQRYTTTAVTEADEADADAAAFKDHARHLADAVRRDMRRRGELAEGQVVDVTIHAKVSTRPTAPPLTHWPPSPAGAAAAAAADASTAHHRSLTRSPHIQDPTHLQEPSPDEIMLLPARMPGADLSIASASPIPRTGAVPTPPGGHSPSVVAAAARPESSHGSTRGRVGGFLSRVAHLPGKLLSRGRSSSRSPAGGHSPPSTAAPPAHAPTAPLLSSTPTGSQRPVAQLQRPTSGTADDLDLFTPATSPDTLPQHRQFPRTPGAQSQQDMRLPTGLRTAAPTASPTAQEVFQAADELVQAGLHAVLSPISLAATSIDDTFYPAGAGRRARVAALETAESLGRAMLLETEEAVLRRAIFATVKHAYAHDDGGRLGAVSLRWLEVAVSHSHACRHKLSARHERHRHHLDDSTRAASLRSSSLGRTASTATATSRSTSTSWTSSWSSSESCSSYDSTTVSDVTTVSDNRADVEAIQDRVTRATVVKRSARTQAEAELRAVENAKRAAVHVIRNADANVQDKLRQVVTSVAEAKAQLQVAGVQRKLRAVDAVGGAATTLRVVKADAQEKVDAAQVELSVSQSEASVPVVHASKVKSAHHSKPQARDRSQVRAPVATKQHQHQRQTTTTTVTRREHSPTDPRRNADPVDDDSSTASEMSSSPPYRPPRSAAVVPRVFAGNPAPAVHGGAHTVHQHHESTPVHNDSPRPLLDLDAGLQGKSLNLTSLDPALVTHTHHPSTNATPGPPQSLAQQTAPTAATTTTTTTTVQTFRNAPAASPLSKKKKHGPFKGMLVGKRR